MLLLKRGQNFVTLLFLGHHRFIAISMDSGQNSSLVHIPDETIAILVKVIDDRER